VPPGAHLPAARFWFGFLISPASRRHQHRDGGGLVQGRTAKVPVGLIWMKGPKPVHHKVGERRRPCD
jgi:hypothetical protein